MSPINKILKPAIICIIMMTAAVNTVKAQNWMFGLSGAGNLNYLTGTTQRLDNSYFVPTAFHKGTSIRPFGSILLEYNPHKIFGGMLNVGYDGRGADFDNVIAPCNCPATLTTNLSYVTVEPSLRMNLGNASNLFFFLGPRVAFNLDKNYDYTQLKQADRSGDLSAVKKTIFSGQVGLGYDYTITNPGSPTKVVLSPFVSYHPYFGQDPRTIESLSVTTGRAGVAIKFGKGSKVEPIKDNKVMVPTREVDFSVRAPKMISTDRKVSETLPLLNYVFFDEGSNAIPDRYVKLSNTDASNFKEAQLQTEQTISTNGRSSRQLNVYYNILNIIGDRMRSNPGSSVDLSGASTNGQEEGKLFAEEIKQYLVSMFNINDSRITTQGRIKPLIPSEQPGGTKELVLLRQGDRRVDITSSSPELALEVGGKMMKPVIIQSNIEDPLDSHLIFNVDGASDLLKSYTIDLTDNQGKIQHYGPYYHDQESVSGNTILAGNKEGDYTVTMNGINKNGTLVKKVKTVHLVRQDGVIEKGYRYSILFNFDKAETIASYEKFLTDEVSSLITDGSNVIIHGHTDIIGSEEYNHTLSHNRALETQKILERALSNAGKKNVTFETYGFGEELDKAPFGNTLPEERSYNRTVIIDISSSK
ncbi:MAG: OmpA family protein [Bacteroidetes bacterium]|nr:OmpA family protein [Bacteroidota bacterium]MBU1483648.1 OmpA family protein [Bacteroidota bacterium]MBU2267150.1 OmpA family protein [Bacteroidota bacterium]MBU2375083.1 OmpA family protein [Bacteroidota bacterium]